MGGVVLNNTPFKSINLSKVIPMAVVRHGWRKLKTIPKVVSQEFKPYIVCWWRQRNKQENVPPLTIVYVLHACNLKNCLSIKLKLCCINTQPIKKMKPANLFG